ncbi:hypothetical protein CEXT_64471 [Caerostris extrusa]|uniref:Uncharacterized protein n=1 Tax=Caerostris extrusa TaxID=172846 RepID=A0AAV4S155_CAEEX|nr:hypothetical protein CEXT_64471 [Caerostris extrusa]
MVNFFVSPTVFLKSEPTEKCDQERPSIRLLNSRRLLRSPRQLIPFTARHDTLTLSVDQSRKFYDGALIEIPDDIGRAIQFATDRSTI